LLMDTDDAASAPDFQPALSVLVTVVSKTESERIVVDAGCKAISGERGLPSIKGIDGLRLKALHAEHAPIELLDPRVQVEVGDKIELAVRYHDGTVHLHQQMYGVARTSSKRFSPSNSDIGSSLLPLALTPNRKQGRAIALNDR